MTITRKLQIAGVDKNLVSAIMGDSVTNLVATGTTQATAFRINSDVAKFTTVTAGTGAILPVGTVELDTVTVVNAGDNDLLVYPALGEKVGALATNAAFTLQFGSAAIFRKSDAFTWDVVSNYSVSSGGSGSGTITGTIAAGQIAYGTDDDEIGGSSSLTWVNAAGLLGVGTSTQHSSLQVNGSQAVKTTNAATSYTVASTDHIIRVTDTSAARTITLPTAVGIGGRVYEIKDVSGGAGINNITIDGNGSETIDGAASVKITIGGGVVRVISNGTSWDLMTPSDYTLDPGVPTAGLVADWNASSLSSVLSNGDFVTSFVDAISSRTLTASGFDRPTFYSAGSPSGGPAIEFGGVDDKLAMALPPGLPDAANPGTIIAIVSGLAVFGVMPTRTIVQYGELFGFGARGLAFNSSKQLQTYDGDHVLMAPSAPTGYGTRVIGHSYTGAVESLFVDGVECASSVVTLTTNNLNFVIGDNVDAPVSPGAFRLMRLLIYNRILSAGEWRRVMEHARAAHNAF